MVGCATKEILFETTKCLEDAEWGLSKLRSVNAIKTFCSVADEEVDDDDDDGTEAEKHEKYVGATKKLLYVN